MRRWLATRRHRKTCPHSNVHGVYGDDINRLGGARLWCGDCGSALAGPVEIANLRADEPRLLDEWRARHNLPARYFGGGR